jgi:hypothetical protein
MAGRQQHVSLELPVGAKAVIPVDQQDRQALALVVIDETYAV